MALALGAWFVWQRTGQSSDNSNSQQAADSTSQDQEAPAETEKYLVIQELGIKIPLSDQIAGAYYTFQSDELADYVSLYDAGFDGLENANGVPCLEGGQYQIYSISRAKPENVSALGEFAGPEYKSFPFTDAYMYGGLGAHQSAPACSDLNASSEGSYQGDENILRIVDEKEQAFTQSFNNLKPLD